MGIAAAVAMGLLYCVLLSRVTELARCIISRADEMVPEIMRVWENIP